MKRDVLRVTLNFPYQGRFNYTHYYYYIARSRTRSQYPILRRLLLYCRKLKRKRKCRAITLHCSTYFSLLRLRSFRENLKAFSKSRTRQIIIFPGEKKEREKKKKNFGYSILCKRRAYVSRAMYFRRVTFIFFFFSPLPLFFLVTANLISVHFSIRTF